MKAQQRPLLEFNVIMRLGIMGYARGKYKESLPLPHPALQGELCMERGTEREEVNALIRSAF